MSGISPKNKKLRQQLISSQINEKLVNNFVKIDPGNNNVNLRESLLKSMDNYALTNEFPTFLLSFGIQ
jgi:hypothetical protein